MKKYIITAILIPFTLFALTEKEQKAQEEVNVFYNRGNYTFDNQCNKNYTPTIGKVQINMVSDCSNIIDKDHWINNNNQAYICTINGGIGLEIPEASKILNPPAQIQYPTWDEGGKDSIYTFIDDTTNEEVISTYINFCSTSQGIRDSIDSGTIEVNVAEGTMSKNADGSVSGSPIYYYTSVCTNLIPPPPDDPTQPPEPIPDDKRWVNNNNQAYICNVDGTLGSHISTADQYIDGTPSTGCIETQKKIYEDYVNEKTYTRQSTHEECQTALNQNLYDTNNNNTITEDQLNQINTSEEAKYEASIKKTHLINYLIALGYRYIPKEKELGKQSYHINPLADQSFYGLYGPNEYVSNKGLERKDTTPKTDLSDNDLAGLVSNNLSGQTHFSSDNFNSDLPNPPRLNVYELHDLDSGDDNEPLPYPRPKTSTYFPFVNFGGISGNQKTLLSESFSHWNYLYENDRFKDPQGNFSFDVYVQGEGWLQIQYKDDNGAWHPMVPTFLKNDNGFTIGNTNNQYIPDSSGAVLMNGWHWAIIRYKLPFVPKQMRYILDDYAVMTSYDGFRLATEYGLTADFSTLKDINGGYDLLNKLLLRIYNFDKVNKTWDLGYDENGNPDEAHRLVIKTIDNNGNPITAPISKNESISYRYTGNEIADIIKGAKSGVPKDIATFEMLTGYTINTLPIFKFQMSKLRKHYEIEVILDLYGNTCPSGYVERANGMVAGYKICVQSELINSSHYNFTYNPFENEKAQKGETTNREADPFTFIDLYTYEYKKDRHNEDEIVNTSALSSTNGNSPNSVEGLIGRVTINHELNNCVEELNNIGFDFKEVRKNSDNAIKETETNFLKRKIKIYTDSTDDIIEEALNNKKEEYKQTLSNQLESLKPFIKDDVEDQIINNILNLFKQTLDYTDTPKLYLETINLNTNLTPENIKDMAEIINNEDYSSTTSLLHATKIPENAIIVTNNSLQNIFNTNKENIILNLQINKIYLYIPTNYNADTGEYEVEEHVYELMNPIYVNDIITYDTNGDLQLINKEDIGIVYTEDGTYISTEDINNKIKQALSIGFVPIDIQRQDYAIPLLTQTNYSTDKNEILTRALTNTDMLCANAMYFDYQADRILRNKLDAWNLLIKKALSYLTEVTPTTPDKEPTSKYYNLYQAITGSSLSHIINNRTSIWRDQSECDHIHLSLRHGLQCKPGGGGRLFDLRTRANQDITTEAVRQFIKNISDTVPELNVIDESLSFNMNGTTINIGDLSSELYANVPQQTIMQSYKKVRTYKNKDLSKIPCLDCTKIDFKSRSQVAQEVIQEIKKFQIALNKKISGLLNFSAWQKCRNDLHTTGYSYIDRNIFNPNFINTNPENLIENRDNITFETTRTNTNTSNFRNTTIHVKINNSSEATKTAFCNNLMNSTKFYDDNNVVNTTMEHINEVHKDTGTILTQRYFDSNPHKDIWGDPNPYQTEICSSINIKNTSGTGQVLKCVNPILGETDVDKNFIEIGIAQFDVNNKYNMYSFPYDKGLIEFIDVYEMVQDNQTGASQSMFGNLSLVQDFSELEGYNDKSRLKTSYENCLDFKSKSDYKKKINTAGTRETFKVFPNLGKYYSYKADVCRNTDTQNTPPKFYKDQYCKNNCDCVQDKVLVVKNCTNIIYRNKIITGLENHTCNDVNLEQLMKKPEGSETTKTANEIKNEALDKTIDTATKTKQQLDLGAVKKIKEDGHIEMKYSNKDSSIKAQSISGINTSSSTDDAVAGGKDIQVEGLSDMDSVQNSQGSANIQEKTVNISTYKNEKVNDERKITTLQSKHNVSYNSPTSNTDTQNAMQTANQQAIGKNQVDLADNKVEQLETTREHRENTPSNKQQLNAQYTNNDGMFKSNNYDLSCTNCGGWNTSITKDQMIQKAEQVNQDDKLNQEEKTSVINDVDINNTDTDTEVYNTKEEIKNNVGNNNIIKQNYNKYNGTNGEENARVDGEKTTTTITDTIGEEQGNLENTNDYKNSVKDNFMLNAQQQYNKVMQ